MSNKFSKCMKKIIAAALVLTLVGGVSATGIVSDIVPVSITASALDSIDYLDYTLVDGTLTINSGTYLNPRFQNLSYDDRSSIKKIVASAGVVFQGDCEGLLSSFNNVEEIDVSNVNTSAVTSMRYLFQYNTKLTTLKLGNLDTSNVTDMFCMFSNLRSITSINLGSAFDTSNVTIMREMFANNYKLESLDLGDKFDTSNVTDFSSMFQNCTSLRSIDMGDKFFTPKVTDMSYMFDDCSCLEAVDISKMTANVQSVKMSYMFSGCTKLSYLDFSGFTGYSYSNQMYMLDDCGLTSFTKKDGFTIHDNAKLRNKGTSRDMKYTYAGWYNVDEPDNILYASGSSTIYFASSYSGTFMLKTESTGINYSINGDTLTLISGNYQETNVKSIYVYEKPSHPGITKIVASSDAVKFSTKGSNYAGLFYQLEGIKSIDISKADFTGITNLKSMFSYCNDLESLTLGSIDTSAVTDMSQMFYSCSKLTTIDISGLNTSSAENMSSMFGYCTSLETIVYGEDFTTSNVTDFSYMFTNCSALTDFDFSKFNTSSVTNMNGMFQSCDSVNSFDFGNNFDTSNVTDFSSMFSNCNNLKILDLSMFNTSAAENMSSMFSGSSSLENIVLTGFDTSNVTNFSNMFEDCTSLKELDLSSFDSGACEYESNNVFYKVPLEKLTISDKFPITEDMNLNNTYTTNGSKTAVIGWTKTGSDEIVSGGNRYAVLSGAGTYQIKSTELKWTYSFDHDENTGNRVLKLESGYYNSAILEAVRTECTAVLENYLSENEIYPSYIQHPYVSELEKLIVEDGVVLTGNCSSLFDISYMGSSTLQFNGHIHTENLTNTSYMFSSEQEYITIIGLDLTDFDTSGVTDMSNMFYRCNLEELDLSSFDTRSVTNMKEMFKDCTAKKITFGDKFDTSKVFTMAQMFSGCSSLEELDVSSFNTSNVGNVPENVYVYDSEAGMYSMFSGCSSLKKLDLSSFDTSENTTMQNMFDQCSSLEEIKTGDKFNIKSLEREGLKNMFSGCSSLKAFDFSSFGGPSDDNENPASSLERMFSGCSSLKKIDLSKADLSNVYDFESAFQNCTSLEEVSLPALRQEYFSTYGFNKDFDGCIKIRKITVPAGFEFNSESNLQNKNAVYTGWHKEGSEQIVSGDGEYAEFIAEKAEGDETDILTYIRDFAKYDNCIVNGASLTLEGQIGLNFYAVFPDQIMNDKDAYVVLSGPKGDQKLKISDAGFDLNSGFKFTYKLAAKQIRDNVSFTVYNGNNEKQVLFKSTADGVVSAGDENVYSYRIEDYVQAVKNNQDNYSENLVSLVKALETYGTYAQILFNYNNAGLDTAGLLSIDDLTSENMDSYTYFSISDDMPEDLSFEGYSLVLESETRFKLYFSSNDISKHTFMLGENKLTPVSAGENKYYISINNISAKNLRKTYTIHIDGDSYDYYVQSYPLSYAKTALKAYESSNDKKKNDLCNAMRALYRYSEAAYDYFGSPDYDW